METELGVGCFGPVGANSQWTVGRAPSREPNSYTLGSSRMEPWTDGEPVMLTSDFLRDPRSIKCRASHACEPVLAFCSSPLCCESGFAMRLCLPGP